MNKDEALDLALEALEYFTDTSVSAMDHAMAEDAITAIKQVRSAPVQEPVAWTVSGKITDWSKDFSAYQTKHYTRPVYTPPAAQRQCNWPTCQSEEYQQLLAEQIKQELVTGAAQRQWTGLTDEERMDCIFATNWSKKPLMDTAKLIEAKLKEKNT